MSATWLGPISYCFGLLFDVASIRSWPRVKPAFMAAMVVAQVVGVVRLVARSPRMAVPAPVRRVAAVIAPISIGAMIYSVFIEVPLRKAWIEQGHTDELVTDGTYALTRHPGVLWYGVGIGALAIATRSRRLLVAAPLWWLGDVGHVWFQDRHVLPRVFGEQYREYQQTTPFVLPSARSLRRFLGVRSARRG